MRMKLIGKAAMVLLALTTLMLTACGGDPDETVPALAVDGDFQTLTTENSVTLSGTIESGADLEVIVAGETTAAMPVPVLLPDNRWTVEIPNLLEGSNLITLSARDRVGNTNSILLVIVKDTLGPTAVVLPADKAIDVGVDTAITAAFDEIPDEPSISQSSFELKGADDIPVPAEVNYDPINRVATLQPKEGLQPGVLYSVILSPTASPIKDLLGNTMAEVAWSFTTAAIPSE